MSQYENGIEQDQIGNQLQAQASVMSDDVKPAPDAESDAEIESARAPQGKINIGTGY